MDIMRHIQQSNRNLREKTWRKINNLDKKDYIRGVLEALNVVFFVNYWTVIMQKNVIEEQFFPHKM